MSSSSTADLRLPADLRGMIEAVRARERQYRQLAEQATDGVIVLSGEGQVVDASPGAAALLGRPRAALVELTLTDLVEADFVDAVGDLLRLVPGRRGTRIARIRRMDGGRPEAELAGRRLQDGRLQVALRDLSERQRAAQELRRSEERYEALLVSAADALLIESSGRIAFANLALRRLLGMQPAAPVAGRSLADFVHPDERAEVARVLASAAAAGAPGTRLLTRLRRIDGSFVEVEGLAVAVSHHSRDGIQLLLRETAEGRRPASGDLYRDSLTGLTSPMLVPDRLSVAIAQAYRHRARVGVVHVDLDRFSALNERLGSAQGDRLLRAAARRLGQCVRHGDTAARLEADAFVLLLPGLHHAEDAGRIGEKAVRAMRKPFPFGDGPVPLTASAGVAVFPEDGEDAPALLAAAERAARRALAAGGDRIEASSPPPFDQGVDALELEAGLRAALGSGQMTLNGSPPPAGVIHYQPILSVPTRRVVAVEALLRWQHPQLGLVFPQSFLSRADFTGLILAIGPWIVRTAAVQAREWQRRHRTLRLAVNLAPPELMKKTLPDEVRAALDETGLPARLLQLEVPEGHVVSDLPRSLDMLHRLKALGVGLVLDRFAVRYSSLGRLAELPLDGVKLDLAFLRGPSSYAEDLSLLTAVAAVARGLKLRLLAQGVETREQLALVDRLGCEEAQGYFLSPPSPPSAVAERLDTPVSQDAEGGRS